MNNYFVLVASDVEQDDAWEAISAYDIATERLRSRQWPIYPRTRNRAVIGVGDECLIYLGGKGPHSQAIVGSATVADITRKRSWIEPANRNLVDTVAFALTLKNPKVFETPVRVRPLLNQLTFVSNTAAWGGAFQGGCRKIQEEDYALLSGTTSAA